MLFDRLMDRYSSTVIGMRRDSLLEARLIPSHEIQRVSRELTKSVVDLVSGTIVTQDFDVQLILCLHTQGLIILPLCH
jgi:hypothetical protein